MTREELRDIIRKRLGETTAAFWTDAEVNTYINLGCKDIAWRTKCLRDNTTFGSISCVSSTVSEKSNEYIITTVVDPNCYAITEAFFKVDGENYSRLKPTTREDLNQQHSEWQSLVGYTHSNTATGVTTYNYTSNSSTPTHYYWNREEDVFGLYPPPNDDQANSDGVKVYFTYKNTDLSSDSATPSLPEPLHLGIVAFCVASGLEDRGWGDRANDWWEKYFAKINDYRVETRNEREDDEVIMKSIYNVM